jgi:hypothetical protein
MINMVLMRMTIQGTLAGQAQVQNQDDRELASGLLKTLDC